MKPSTRKRWIIYVVVFFVILFSNSLVRRLLPYEELKDGNLLINGVFSLLLTVVIAAIDYAVRKWRGKRGY